MGEYQSSEPFALAQTGGFKQLAPGSFSSVVFTNTRGWLFVATTIDCTESTPTVDDNAFILYGFSSTFVNLFATTVGTGHTGGFHDQWNGHLVVPPGTEIICTGLATDPAAQWGFVVQGYWLNALNEFSLAHS